MKPILKYCKPFTWLLILTLILKLVAAVMELMIPAELEKIVDIAMPSGKTFLVYSHGIRMLILAIIAFGTNYIANALASVNSAKIAKVIRYDLFHKISNLSARQMDHLTTSSAVTRLTTDTYNINRFLVRFQRLGVRAPILMVGGIVVMLFMDSALTLVLMAAMPLVFCVVYFITKYTVPLYARVQKILDRLVRTLQENITGIRVVKALSKVDYEQARYDSVNTELSNMGLHVDSIMAITGPATTLILNLSLACVVLIGAYRVNGGAILPGVIIAFINYFTIILNATLGITRIFVVYSKGAASANRIDEVLNIPKDMPLSDILPEQTDCHVEFRHVFFSYNGSEHNLTDLSFRLKRGETLGVIGATGSGKTTIVNLLMRFYDIDEGAILIDGKNVKSIPKQELRNRFGVVFQNDFLVGDTIRENIRFFRDLSDEALSRAAELAQASRIIAEKEDGLNSLVALRGNNLSGGQRQRLLIARALAASPEILILDDSSSALDYQTDAELRKALHQNYEHTTKVVVAQRISSIQHADCILVLDNGEVLGEGTHEYLMETCPFYREIAEIQMEAEGLNHKEVIQHATSS